MNKNKLIIYQLLPRLFGPRCTQNVYNGSIKDNPCGKFNDISNQAISEIRDLGVTDIWLTGVIRHASSTDYSAHGIPASHPDLLKGKAGSPYAVRDYYDIDPDLAVDVPKRMEEFENLIQRARNLNIGIFIDFIPNHVSRDYNSTCLPSGEDDLGIKDKTNVKFDPNNNFYYLPGEQLQLPGKGRSRKMTDRFQEEPAKVTGNDIFSPRPDTNDWYETIKLNYGHDFWNKSNHFNPIPDTWNKMLNILQFWADKGIRGFRCDMAGMVAPEFWEYAISNVKLAHPEIVFIAEIYEPNRYHDYINTGFDFLYDKVGLYDITRSILQYGGNTSDLTNHWKSLGGLDNKMLRFLENHDEQRISSKYFVNDPWKALPGMALAAMMNSGPLLVYFGQEVGEPAHGKTGFSGDDGRTSIFDYTSLPELMKWINNGEYDGGQLNDKQQDLRFAYRQLVQYAGRNHVFSSGSFYDLMWVNNDLPSKIRNRIFAFLRYTNTDYYLIAVNFSAEISEINIRITDHPLKAMGLSEYSRFMIESLHPALPKRDILISQIVSSGIKVKFDKTGWSAIKISG